MITTNVIHNEDCLTTMSNLPDSSVHMVLTSPPYDNMVVYESGHTWSYTNTLSEIHRILVDGGVCVWNVDDQCINGGFTCTSMRHILYCVDEVGFKLHQTIIWSKQGFSYPSTNRYHHTHEHVYILTKGNPRTFRPVQRTTTTGNTGNEYDVWSIPNGSSVTEDKWIFGQHPCPMSEELVRRCIYTWSNPNDIVYDPFGGSGTTGKVCVQLNRRYILSDVSPEYCSLSRKRIQKYQTTMDDLYLSLTG